MANIGRKLKTKGVIILLTLGLIGTGCEDHNNNPEVDLLGGKTVEVNIECRYCDRSRRCSNECFTCKKG